MNLWRSRTQGAGGVTVGIDAGNVDVRVVVARMKGTGPADDLDAAVPVLGVGVVPAQGLSRGRVTDPRRLGEAIRTAVAQAERAAGHRVLAGYFSVPLSHLHPAAHGDRPCRLVLTSAAELREVTLHTADRAAVWHDVARHAGLEIVGVVPSALAASAAVVLAEEHEHGVIVVECGAEHTSVVVFSAGAVLLVGTIPVGGDHITRDLASILGIEPREAERIKCEVGNFRHGSADIEVLVRGVDGARKSVSVALIAAIITARVEQMLRHVSEMVKPVLSAAHPGESRHAPHGVGQVVLCGGGAALSGLAPMARSALGMPVRIAGAWGIVGPASVQSPSYAAVLGLLRWRAAVRPRPELPNPMADWPAPGTARAPRNAPEFADQPVRIGQTRWQAWLREFLP